MASPYGGNVNQMDMNPNVGRNPWRPQLQNQPFTGQVQPGNGGAGQEPFGGPKPPQQGGPQGAPFGGQRASSTYGLPPDQGAGGISQANAFRPSAPVGAGGAAFSQAPAGGGPNDALANAMAERTRSTSTRAPGTEGSGGMQTNAGGGGNAPWRRPLPEQAFTGQVQPGNTGPGNEGFRPGGGLAGNWGGGTVAQAPAGPQMYSDLAAQLGLLGGGQAPARPPLPPVAPPAPPPGGPTESVIARNAGQIPALGNRALWNSQYL